MNEAKKMEGLWDKAEVAAYLDVPVRTVEDWVHDGYIPSLKLGKHRKFTKEAIDSWLKTLTQRPTKR